MSFFLNCIKFFTIEKKKTGFAVLFMQIQFSVQVIKQIWVFFIPALKNVYNMCMKRNVFIKDDF